MDDERNENEVNENEPETVAQEEETVEDTDADTRDVEETIDDSSAETERRFSGIEATLQRILGEIASLREAQGVLVENGYVVNDIEADLGMAEEDEFIPPKEMDLLI